MIRRLYIEPDPRLDMAPFGTATFTQSEVNGDYLGFENNIAAWRTSNWATTGSTSLLDHRQ